MKDDLLKAVFLSDDERAELKDLEEIKWEDDTDATDLRSRLGENPPTLR